MASLKNFKILTTNFTQLQIENLDKLHNLQSSIIKHFLEFRSESNINHLHDSFIYLRDEEVIDKLSLEKLLSLFNPSKFNNADDKDSNKQISNKDSHSYKDVILQDVVELKELINNSKELKKVEEYLKAQKFSIGITGVMNAGKSTMLNALMGEEILGTSVIPETANLTIVKYAKTTSVKVVYWNHSQWEQIKRSANSFKSLEKFVKETQEHFKNNLDKFILPISRKDEINIEDLSSYTSASSSDKKCNLIQYVELYSPLDFLESGIEIVDTPGLDDIVIQREEITKEYLSRCDLMIHLMNVSQSATIKDIEFIIDAILYQNITQVLIVITRIDLVSAKDIKEVIAYTRESISKKLHEQNSSSKIDFVLQSIHFIPLSGKMALLHKTGKAQEAISSGYTLEQSGIVEVENYLKKVIFSNNNTHTSLILRSAKNRISKTLHKELEKLRFESSLLFKTEDEVDADLNTLKNQKIKQESSLKLLTSQISGYEIELTNYIDTLQSFLDNELKSLQVIIKQRLMDETKYCLEKDKKAPLISSQSRIVETALKHGLIDIIREYRYKFIKKSSKISEIISLQFDEIKENDDDETNTNFDHKSIFDESFKRGFLTSNNSALLQRLTKVLGNASLSKLEKIDSNISEIIKDEFIYIESKLKSKALTISKTLLDEFFSSLKENVELFQNKINESEELLVNHMKFLKDDDGSRQTKSLEIHRQIDSIEEFTKRYPV